MGGLIPFRPRRNPFAKQKEEELIELYGVRQPLISKLHIALIVAAVFFVVHTYLAVFYYNKLMTLYQDIGKEEAKIESLLQRARNITINLVQASHNYAVHEQGIFDHVSEMRLSSKPTKGGDRATGATTDIKKDHAQSSDIDKNPIENIVSLLKGANFEKQGFDKQLSALMAIAESYPDLKLSDNVRRLMEALVEIEKDICSERMNYAEVVNLYSTARMTFPGNIFGWAMGFRTIPYYKADSDSKYFISLQMVDDQPKMKRMR